MSKRILLALVVIVSSSCAPTEKTRDFSYLIFPNPEEKIVLVATDNVDRKMLSGIKADPETPLSVEILSELNAPYHQSVIKLNQCSRNLSGNVEGPNVLFLSGNEGGFPRHGLILTEGDHTREYPDLNYVDLVLNEDRLANGELYIFSHELGHVMLNNVWSNFGETAGENLSPLQHVSMGVTDYYKAFNEGWAMHFEALANEVETYHNDLTSSYDYDSFYKNVWHSNIDKEMRANAVVQNGYIYRKVLPASDYTDEKNLETMILLAHTSPLLDKTRLKNAQQMLSCEGFIATLFFRITKDKILQDNYLDRDFYRPFLISDLPEDVSPTDIFTPFENINLKIFKVMQRLSEKGAALKDFVPVIEFIKEWCRTFPEDREELLKLFVGLTVGKTITADLGRIYEKMAYFGVIGEYFKYREQLDIYQQELGKLIDKLLKDEVSLDANVGPELWATNEHFMIRRTLWSENSKAPLSVNVNTADQFEIAALSGVSVETAARIVKARDEREYFKSMDELREFGVEISGGS